VAQTGRTVCRALCLWAVLAATATVAAQDGDPFYRGLQERGLKSLMEAYEKGEGPEAGEADVAARSLAAQAALEAEKAARRQTAAERDPLFEKSRRLYEEAIAEAEETLAKIPADQREARAEQKLQILNWRIGLGKMIFQNWLRNDLDLMEVTDRRAGNRQKATRLLKMAKEQYRTALRGITEWLAEIDRDTQHKGKYLLQRKLKDLRRDAKYKTAWIIYYHVWGLPEDWEPAEGERSRKDLLNDAITAFQGYTDLPDRVAAKWYAHLVIGLAHRELGKTEEALNAFAAANAASNNAADSKDAEPLKIRVAFEEALTHLRRGEHKKCREAVENAREFFGKAKLEQNLHGLALPLVEAESYFLEGEAEDNQALKDKGLSIFETVSHREGPWRDIVAVLLMDVAGEETDPEDLDPLPLWSLAGKTYKMAEEAEDPKQLEEAMRLYRIYADKVGGSHANYVAALYNQAACLYQLGRKAEAAQLFYKVAETDPKYKYASEAAKHYVRRRGELYELAKTDENRDLYEEALAWFVAHWLEADPGQRYVYAVTLYQGKKYQEAADQFAKVPTNLENHPDARYWVALCDVDFFLEKVVGSGDEALILSRARRAAQGLIDFAAYATQVEGLGKEKKEQLLDWAEEAHFRAADLYMYPGVELPADALQILDAMEKKFTLGKEMRGRALKLRIDVLQKLGRLDDALQVLDKFLDAAKPEEVGPVLRGLFRAMIDDVRNLVKRGETAAAATKVKDAETLGNRLREWLAAGNVENKELEAENVQYDLAELYLAVGDYSRALGIYLEIGGPKPEEQEPVKIDCVYGMARCYQGLGQQAPSAEQAKQHFERAMELWRIMLELEEVKGRRADQERLWEFRYEVFECRYRLGERKEVWEGLDALEILNPPLGGKDPLLQRRFRELRAKAKAEAQADLSPGNAGG